MRRFDKDQASWLRHEARILDIPPQVATAPQPVAVRAVTPRCGYFSQVVKSQVDLLRYGRQWSGSRVLKAVIDTCSFTVKMKPAG